MNLAEQVDLSGLIWFLDYAGVFIFAATGALVASRAQLDLVGFIFMAVLTAVGGGTLRDLVLGRDPVFWVEEPTSIVLAASAAFIVFWTAHLMESRYRVLLWLDTMALSLAVSAGVGVAVEGGFDTVIILIAGVLTGTFGGLMRDVVANEVPLVLKQQELYLTAAFGGALATVIALYLGVERNTALIICVIVCFILRAGSLLWGWKLPVYKTRPPRVNKRK